jgi:predicted regulator of Ras-like GTPase activity (Roadblock/LC7/MglB family)
MRICTNCGTTNADGLNACKNCGLPIKSVNSVTVLRRKKPITPQNQSKPSDFNPVQHLQKISTGEKKPMQSIKPKISDLEYKFRSPSQIQNSIPLKSIPPTPVENLVIPQPIQPRRRQKENTQQQLNPVAQDNFPPIILSDNTISNTELSAIPQRHPSNTSSSIQPVNVPRMNSQPQSGSSSNHPIMAFSSQTLQSQQIEQEMSNIMSVFRETSSSKYQRTEEIREQNIDESIPNSLDDILINLSQLDLNIEASALVKTSGEIIASAISERIDEFLISTITNTLGTISQDVISSLESGDLKFISLFATKGILFLSPIMKNVFLVLYTTSEAKIGLINLARMVVKKKIEMYYAKQNLQKSPV